MAADVIFSGSGQNIYAKMFKTQINPGRRSTSPRGLMNRSRSYRVGLASEDLEAVEELIGVLMPMLRKPAYAFTDKRKIKID
ncbi:hypothetical protein Bhyg_11592, partial [Pseudolycoriella hygida]